MGKCDFIALTLRDVYAHKGPPTVSLGIETAAPTPRAQVESPVLRPLVWSDTAEGWPVLPQAQVYVGDRIAVTVASEKAGYLSLFNLGAGGGSGRLFPNEDQTRNGMRPGQVYRFWHDGGAPWEVLGPSTALGGGLEYFLAIVSSAPGEFLLHDISHRLRSSARERVESPPAGGGLGLRIPRLFTLPRASWEYGLAALRVEAAHMRARPAS